MKYHHLFQVKKGVSSEEASLELSFYLDYVYEIVDQETETVQIGGYSDVSSFFPNLQHSTLKDSTISQDIDWDKQWASFAPNFQEGFAHIDLEGKALLLKPGAGFGDLSHPTTRLVLKLMVPFVKDHLIFDLGCGSGILSVAAALLDAKRVLGIDIDPEALTHSQENAKINGVEDRTHFSKSIELKAPIEHIVILMNMIESEQERAWEACRALHEANATVIISGLLSSQVPAYLQIIKTRNWTFIKEVVEEGWSGLIFEQKF